MDYLESQVLFRLYYDRQLMAELNTAMGQDCKCIPMLIPRECKVLLVFLPDEHETNTSARYLRSC